MADPNVWSQLLDVIDTPGCVVAGGAVRDYVLGVPFKDIDIFVPGGAFRFNARRMQLDLVPFFIPFQEDRYDVENILRVQSYRLQGQSIVQFIILREGVTVQQHLESFDLGINQVCFTKSGIQMSRAFIDDWKSQSISVHNEGPNTLDRAERFRQKFSKHLKQTWTVNQ